MLHHSTGQTDLDYHMNLARQMRAEYVASGFKKFFAFVARPFKRKSAVSASA